jgi:4'-phosphopantetheinyl transferase
LRAAPAELFIEEDHFGRPRLASQSPWAGALDFNVSHSAGVAAIAVSRCSAVGIDVEVVRSVPDACALAQRFFTPAECRELALKSASALDRAFLTCWTRKEAVLKCTGVGLRFNPAHLDVGLDEQDRVIRICATGPEVLLNVTSMALGPDIIVSVARDRGVPISRIFFPDDGLCLRAESIGG